MSLLLLNALLVLVVPFVIVGGMTVIAAVQQPEVLRRPSGPRSRMVRPSGRAVWA